MLQRVKFACPLGNGVLDPLMPFWFLVVVLV